MTSASTIGSPPRHRTRRRRRRVRVGFVSVEGLDALRGTARGAAVGGFEDLHRPGAELRRRVVVEGRPAPASTSASIGPMQSYRPASPRAGRARRPPASDSATARCRAGPGGTCRSSRRGGPRRHAGCSRHRGGSRRRSSCRSRRSCSGSRPRRAAPPWRPSGADMNANTSCPRSPVSHSDTPSRWVSWAWP